MKRGLPVAGLCLLGVFLFYMDGSAEGPGPNPIVITAEVEAIPPVTVDAMVPDGAWVLTSDSSDFGGLSGLLVTPDKVIAVTDKGRMLRADWSIEVGALRFRSATLTQLEEAGRGHLSGEAADAESLAVTGEDLLISFERDHRILRQTSAGDLVPWAVPDGIEDLGSNSGIEALVGLGDGRVLAIAEDVIDGAAPLWLFRDGTIETRGSLSLASHHRVTAAALGPSGALYLTRRSFSVVDGVSIRIERFALKNGLPDPATRRELAAFESESGIDNIEGLALVEETPGVTALWAIADDNFNPLQRTVLLRFVLKGRP